MAVTAATLLVTANPQTSVYGSSLPPLTFTVTGLLNGDTSANVLTGGLATTATKASSVGAYPIVQGNLASNSNYTLAVTNSKLTVTPASLTIAALASTKIFGDPLATWQ